MPMGRPVVTTFTPEQLAGVAAANKRDREIARALRTPECRAGAKFASYAQTASEALAALRTLFHEGSSLLVEKAEEPLIEFLGACGNAERAWDLEGLSIPAAASRRLAIYREEYRGMADSSRLFPRL